MKANEIRAVFSKVDPDVDSENAFRLFVEAVAQLAEIAEELSWIHAAIKQQRRS